LIRLAALAFAAVVAGAAALPAEPSLTGRVVDAAGDPLAGAAVKAFVYRSPQEALLDRTLGVEPAAVSESTTGADGAFHVSVPGGSGEVSLRVSASGRPAVELAGPFGAEDAEEPIEVAVPDGRVLSGRVTGESGAPVAGALVRASAPLDFPEDSAAADETKSGPDGTFSLAAAPKGDVTLRVLAKGFAPASDRGARPATRVALTRGGAVEGVVRDAKGRPVSGAIVASADAAARSDGDGKWRIPALREGLASLTAASEDGDRVARKDGIRVRKGAVVPVDLVLQPETGIAGMIVDAATKRPIARARVEALDDPYPMPSSVAAARARTDSRGRFRLVGLIRREYRVAAWRTGYLVSSVPMTAASPAAGPVRIALARGGTISGRVVDEAGAGVAAVRVRSLPGESRRGMLLNHPTRAPAPSAVTRAGGAFELAGLPTGVPLTIVAARSGYVAARREGLAATAAKGKPVTLVLRRGLEAHGRVVDDGGAPVAAAEVTLSRVEEHRMAGAVVSIDENPDATRTARSGADGRFAVAALDGGKYQATVKHPSYAPLIVPGLNVRDPAPADWSPFVLRPPAPVTGVVRSRKGDPVSGARISAWGEGGSDEARTDAEGRFRLAGFPAGASITLDVAADGFAPGKQAVKAPASDVAIVLSTAATVRGRVEDSGTRQPVTDFSIGGRVERVSYIESRAVRSEDGSFEMPDVAPGKLTINVEAPGYLAGSLSGIDLGEGEVKEGVVVSLKKGRAISGRVLDPKGNAVANATVSWRRASAWDTSGFVVGPTGMFAMVSNAATTDADGRFQYDAVPPEKLIFKASHPDFRDAERTVDASAEAAVDISLSDGASISGRVVSGDGSASLAGTEIVLSVTGAAPMALSNDETRADESGAFRFDHLKAGRFKVTAKSASGLSGSADVVLAEGQSDDSVVVDLSGGATIRGVVTGLPPEKLAGLEIHAYQGNFSAAVDAEADGTFAIPGVPPGAVTVIASQKSWAPGARSVSKSVEVPEAGGDVPVEISFAGGSRLEVHVTRGGQPVPGLYVSVRPDPSGSPGAQVYGQTDGDGRAAFDGLPDGAYLLDARSSGSQAGRASRTITMSGDTSIEIALGGGSISGTVTDAASGEPLGDASVSAETGQESSNWAVPSTRTDSQGRYAIDGLDAGDVQVTARRDGYRQKTVSATVADSAVDVSFALAKGGGLPIHATDGLTGTPLSSLWALAFSDSGATSFSGVVPLDGQGNGEVASLAPGTYALHLFSSGYSPRSITANVPSSPVVVALTPGGRVEVHAAAASTARLVDASGAAFIPSPSRLDGRLTIAPPLTVWEHVTPGAYRLIVEGTDGSAEYSVTVREGETTRLELEPL